MAGVFFGAVSRFSVNRGTVQDCYFVPHALLTCLHINGVDYTTNQDSCAVISDIYSVIARLG